MAFSFKTKSVYSDPLLLSKVDRWFRGEKKQGQKKKNDVLDHLIKKMVLKALIFLSMVYTISSDLTDRVRHFETLTSSDLSHKIVKRGIDPNGIHKFNKIREVGFKTLGREFRLILSPKKGLLHPNFKVKLKLILQKKALEMHSLESLFWQKGLNTFYNGLGPLKYGFVLIIWL